MRVPAFVRALFRIFALRLRVWADTLVARLDAAGEANSPTGVPEHWARRVASAPPAHWLELVRESAPELLGPEEGPGMGKPAPANAVAHPSAKQRRGFLRPDPAAPSEKQPLPNRQPAPEPIPVRAPATVPMVTPARNLVRLRQNADCEATPVLPPLLQPEEAAADSPRHRSAPAAFLPPTLGPSRRRPQQECPPQSRDQEAAKPNRAAWQGSNIFPITEPWQKQDAQVRLVRVADDAEDTARKTNVALGAVRLQSEDQRRTWADLPPESSYGRDSTTVSVFREDGEVKDRPVFSERASVGGDLPALSRAEEAVGNGSWPELSEAQRAEPMDAGAALLHERERRERLNREQRGERWIR